MLVLLTYSLTHERERARAREREREREIVEPELGLRREREEIIDNRQVIESR